MVQMPYTLCKGMHERKYGLVGMHLLDPVGALVNGPVDGSGDRERTADDSAKANEEA